MSEQKDKRYEREEEGGTDQSLADVAASLDGFEEGRVVDQLEVSQVKHLNLRVVLHTQKMDVLSRVQSCHCVRIHPLTGEEEEQSVSHCKFRALAHDS